MKIDMHPADTQGDERITVHSPSGQRTLRLHDYAEIYRTPGLYEHVVQDRLRCASPRVVVEALATQIPSGGHVRALDLGAGVGCVADHLTTHFGTATIVGSDSLPEAMSAAERDRPGTYAAYVLDDGGPNGLAALHTEIARHGLNVLVCAGAIDDTHIPLGRLADIWAGFPAGSLIALTGTDDDFSGLSPDALLTRLDVRTRLCVAYEFQHRLRMDGTPIMNWVVLGRRR